MIHIICSIYDIYDISFIANITYDIKHYLSCVYSLRYTAHTVGPKNVLGSYIDLDTSTICAVLHRFDSDNFRLRRNKEMENRSLLVRFEK